MNILDKAQLFMKIPNLPQNSQSIRIVMFLYLAHHQILLSFFLSFTHYILMVSFIHLTRPEKHVWIPSYVAQMVPIIGAKCYSMIAFLKIQSSELWILNIDNTGGKSRSSVFFQFGKPLTVPSLYFVCKIWVVIYVIAWLFHIMKNTLVFAMMYAYQAIFLYVWTSNKSTRVKGMLDDIQN